MTIVEKIVSFARSTNYESIPNEIKKLAYISLIDYIAVTISGAATKEAETIDRYIRHHMSNQECCIIGKKQKASVEDAALCNGTYAHAQDFDDASLIGHPSAVLYSAAFSTAEYSNSSGKDLLRAYIIGYEVTLKIADSLMPKLTANGWHGTSVFCTIGAAIVSGILLGLSDEELKNALGIAASKASGLMANFGTITKPYHTGMSARNGIECALLAKCGVTSSEHAIEGYAQAFAQIKLDANQIYFGDDWAIYKRDPLIKKYPCCSAAHTALDAVVELKTKYSIICNQVHHIDVCVPKFTLNNLIYSSPCNDSQARFSMQYCIAEILRYDKLNLGSFTDQKISDKTTQALMKKVYMHEGEDFVLTPYIDNEPAIVTVVLENGNKFAQRVDFARGTVVNPLSDAEIFEKFRYCTNAYLTEDEQVKLYNLLQRIADEKNIISILQYL